MPHSNVVECARRAYKWDPDQAIREGDYTYAHKRARSTQRRRIGQRGYELARRLATEIPVRRQKEKQRLAELFNEQVRKWKDATSHLSSISRMISHPAYLRIIGLAKDSVGNEIEKLILAEMQSEPDHWFAALTAITGHDPVQPEHNFDEAIEAWLAWGRDNGIN